MKHPRDLLARCARTPRAQDRLTLGQDFGLHEQVAETAVGQVGIEWRQYHFGVTRHFDMTDSGRQIGECDASNLDVVFG